VYVKLFIVLYGLIRLLSPKQTPEKTMSEIVELPSYKKDVKNLISELQGVFPAEKLAVFNNDAAQLGKDHSSPLKIARGDKAPNFKLPNAFNKIVDLSALLLKGPVVLTFYRGVWCPYCNLQLKMFQQILPEIKKRGASLVAISPMNPDNSIATIEASELEFEVLSDDKNRVARQFTSVFKNADEPIQAMSDLGFDFYSFYDDNSAELPVSATFVIDQDAHVLFAKSEGGDYRQRVEPKEIVDILNTLG